MNVSHGVPSGEAAAVDLNRQWTIASANPGEGRRYRQRFVLSLATGGVAETLVLDPATSLRIRASSYAFDATAAGAPERATVTAVDGGLGLRVSLPVARLVGSIRFASAVSPGGKTTRVYRTDGDVVSEEAVASHRNSTSPGASKRVAAEEPAGGKFGVGVTAASEPAHAVVESGAPHDTIGDIAGSGLPLGELGVVDSRVVVRLESDGSFETLSSGDLDAFNLTTGPENLRVGVRLPALGDEIFFLPDAFSLNVQSDVGESLRSQISALVQTLEEQLAADATGESAPVLPDPVEIELVIESDAPCRVNVSGFGVHYRLARASFPSGAPKQIVRGTENPLTPQYVAVAVPRAAAYAAATLTLTGDAPPDGSPTATPTTHEEGPLSLMETAIASGLRVDHAHRWASPYAVTAATLAAGCDLVLASLTDVVSLELALVRDADGRPAGELLASARADIAGARGRQLLRFRFSASPLVLRPGSYWLELAAREGSAVWYLRAAPGERALRREDADWRGVPAVSDAVGASALTPAEDTPARRALFPEIALDGHALSAHREGKDWIYDLTSALPSSTAGGLEDMQLRILSTARGPLTIYPPRFEFEL